MDGVIEWLIRDIYPKQQLANWMVAAGTLLAAVVALGVASKAAIAGVFVRPNIRIDVGDVNRNAIDYVDGGRYYTRLKISNIGKRTARNVYVKLMSIRSRNGNVMAGFDLIVLQWAGSDSEGTAYKKTVDIGPNDHEILYLFYTPQDNPRMVLMSRNPSIDKNRGIRSDYELSDYHLEIRVYGENFGPIERVLRIDPAYRRQPAVRIVR